MVSIQLNGTFPKFLMCQYKFIVCEYWFLHALGVPKFGIQFPTSTKILESNSSYRLSTNFTLHI